MEKVATVLIVTGPLNLRLSFWGDQPFMVIGESSITVSGVKPFSSAAAKTKGLKTVALIGKSGSKMDELANYSLVVPAKTSAHIQELHIAVGNILCDLIEQKLFA